MKIEVTKRELLAMVFGSPMPSYEMMNEIPDKLGEYHGGFNDRWEWNNRISNEYKDWEKYYKEFSEEYLYNLYKKLNNIN